MNTDRYGEPAMIRMRTTFVILVASTILAVAPVAASNAMVKRDKLEKMAETAKTPKDHVAVAKQYRLQAQQFEQKAVEHETTARKLQSSPHSPMSQKWPAMATQPWVKERQLAMEARRAAEECLEAADRHMLLSVEKLAEASPTGSSRSDSVD
jgi:hypothetical protein